MKQKVFFVMSTDDYSGAENVNFSIISELRDKFDFYWVSRKGKINSFLDKENINWIEIKSLSIKEIRRVVKEYNPDILHATDFTASCVCSMSMVKVPIVSHLHHNAPWLKNINYKTILYLMCSFRMKKILIVSDSIEKEYVFSKIIKNKISCINNPLSTKKIRNMVKESDFEKKYDICCVGRLTEAKNPMRWLKIINEIKKEFPDLKCVWVGDGELKPIFLETIIKLGLNENIDVPGFQINPFKYIASSKIYLQTSTWEGFGLSAFESISLGVPTIVSNVGGLPIIIDESCGNLCNTDQEFISSVINILSNPKVYSEKSNRALLKAKNIDNSSSYFEKINKIYNILIEKRG